MTDFASAFRDAPLQPKQVALLLGRQLAPDKALAELTVNDQRIWDIVRQNESSEGPAGYILRYRQYGEAAEVEQ